MHEIEKTFNEQYNFWVVKCSAGHKITTWNEGDDIKEYSAFTIAYCPADANLDIYHCVTDEQDALYVEMQREAHEAEEEARQNENND